MRTEEEINDMMQDFIDHANQSTLINKQFSLFAVQLLEWVLSDRETDLKQKYISMQIECALESDRMRVELKKRIDEFLRRE